MDQFQSVAFTRQREILRLVALGMPNKEIARSLVPPCSEATVKTHLKEIFARLEVKNRAGAAAVWVRRSGE